MPSPLRIGLIGCGRVAERYYLPALSRMSGATLVAVADPATDRHAIVDACEQACTRYGSADELLHDTQVEAVVVTSAPATHPEIVAAALRAGRPVLVEKPLAVAANDELRALAREVVDSRACVQIGFNRRFWRPVRQLRDVLAAERGRAPVLAQLSMSSDVAAWDPVDPSPDALIDLGSHQLDLLRFLLGSEVRSVRASWDGARGMTMRIRLADDSSAECRVVHGEPSHEWIALQSGDRRCRIHASSDHFHPASGARRFARDGATAVLRRLRGRSISLITSFEAQLVDFFGRVRSGDAPSPDVRDGMRVVEALDAVRRSAACGGEEVVLAP